MRWNCKIKPITRRTAVLTLGILIAVQMAGEKRMYRCEVGLQGGVGFYVGDAAEHVFMNPREAYGAQLRYNFNSRWALQAKAQRQRIAFKDYYLEAQTWDEWWTIYQNPVWSVDVVGEFNFFRLGRDPYDVRTKPVSPYILLGLGVSVYNQQAELALKEPYPSLHKEKKAGMYIPFGFGLKWQMAEQWMLIASWQWQMYLVDNVEGMVKYEIDGKPVLGEEVDDNHWNNWHGLNGPNILNNDLTSSLTIGVAWKFALEHKRCLLCDQEHGL